LPASKVIAEPVVITRQLSAEYTPEPFVPAHNNRLVLGVDTMIWIDVDEAVHSAKDTWNCWAPSSVWARLRVAVPAEVSGSPLVDEKRV
jgi:hypothetical protein